VDASYRVELAAKLSNLQAEICQFSSDVLACHLLRDTRVGKGDEKDCGEKRGVESSVRGHDVFLFARSTHRVQPTSGGFARDEPTMRLISDTIVADFNGDGIDDLAVGAPTSHGLRGSVLIFFGVAGGFSTTTPITPNVSRVGLTVGERYGETLAAADSTAMAGPSLRSARRSGTEVGGGSTFFGFCRPRVHCCSSLESSTARTLLAWQVRASRTTGSGGR
jgi:hypothetical protein